MPTRKVAVDYKDFIEFAKFCDSWAQEISKADYINLFEQPGVTETIAEFIGDEIESALDGNAFGRFMAERTYVEIVPTPRGVTFNIGGYSEQEMMEMGRVARISDQALEDMIDYNLWEMYEFHGGAIGTKGIPVGVNKKQAIKKDAAGPLAIRTKTGGTQQLKGRQGLVRAVVGQIQMALKQKILDLLESFGSLIVVETMAEAAAESKALSGLRGSSEKKVRKAAAEFNVDLAKMGKAGQRVAPDKTGHLLVRAGKGRFISSPLHGKKISIRKK